jgi:hypothetical protein
MGGGGGGGGYSQHDLVAMRRALESTRIAEDQRRLEADINRELTTLLAEFNDIDREVIRKRLEEIDECLGDDVQFDEFLLGGSVAKHTAVNGLSDVDALIILDREMHAGDRPGSLLRELRQLLLERLSSRSVTSVQAGTMAVTVTYRDGQEIQLLPALRSGETVQVPSFRGGSWITTNPKEFREQLTSANKAMNGQLVPAIKLFKSVIDGLPSQQQIIGYHAEALAVDAARQFPGNESRTLKGVFLHVLSHASTRVLKPISDVTGQSSSIDRDLGGSNSAERRRVAGAFRELHHRLVSARNAHEWTEVISGVP